MEEQRDVGRVRRFARFLTEFNLFRTDAEDAQTISIQRWSTRTYIFFLVLSISILLLYNGLYKKTQTIKVQNPSLEFYLQMKKTYSDSVCPCSQISVAYGSFVELNPTYHPVCFSDFISQTWIELLVDNKTATRYPGDFRSSASLHFQALRDLCNRSKMVLSNNIQSFYNRKLISGNLMEENLLRINTEAVIETFKTTTFTDFQQSIQFLRTFLIGSVLASGIETAGAIGYYPQNNIPEATFGPIDFQRGGSSCGPSCTCDNLDTCSVPAGFYNDSMTVFQWRICYVESETKMLFVMNNWFVSCWGFSSLISSSVTNSFLNNQSALELVAKYFNWPSNSSLPKVLNLNVSQQADKSKITFNELLQNLFVEDILSIINYSLYYTQCRPQSCVYLISQRSSVLYMFTSLLALYGGLSVVLRFLIPHIITFLIKRLRYRNETTVDTELVEVRASWRQRIGRMIDSLFRLLVTFNMFKSSDRQEPSAIKEQRWTSRIFIVCLTVGFVILIFYTTLHVQMKSIEVNNPSLKTVFYLKSQSEFNTSLQCPCTQINTRYVEFLQLQPIYHQVCSSKFASSVFWNDLRALLQVPPRSGMRNKPDFRLTFQLFFFLTNLCQLTNVTIFNSIDEFQQIQLVTADLLSVEIFNYQMDTVIQQFQSRLANKFLSFFQLTRNITYVNQILAYVNNPRYNFIGSPPNTMTFSINGFTGGNGNSSYTCSCANDINCKTNAVMYSADNVDIPKYVIPGLYKACFPLESLLQSTLECFYDNTDCFTFIINFYNSGRFQYSERLNSSLSSQFAINSSMNVLLSQLFIENWTQVLNYSSYFNKCQPASCFYKIYGRNNLLETFTIIIGLIGGLSVSLRIGVPFIAKFCFAIIRRRPCQRANATRLSIVARFVAVVNLIQHRLQKLNVFDQSTHNILKHVKEQRRATYIYLFLLSAALFVLVIYNSLIYSTITFTVTNPSLEQYQQLQQQYGADAINCPCSQLATSYSSFIEFECKFHPVCTSHFVSQAYLHELFILYNTMDVQYASSNAYTLQGTIFSHFQALLSLCNLAKDAVNDARQNYLATFFITTSLVNYHLFDEQINASLGQFESTLSDSFINNLELIRGMTQSNAFVSLYSTNWYPVLNSLQQYSSIPMTPQYYGNCNCLTSSACTQPSTPFIQGYLIGCTPLEALLHSSIECMYEQDCINQLTGYLNLSLPAPTPLNPSETRFSSNGTVDSILQQMFIETCSSNVSYDQFFAQCHPLSCSVTLIKRNGLIVVFTTLLSLYGGLTTFLKLVIPTFVSIIYKLARKWKNRREIDV